MEFLHVAIEYVQGLDIDYIRWVLWLVYPILITFLLPLCILVLIYVTALMLFIYKQRMKLKAAYDRDFWYGARKTVGALWIAQARIWHGYEVEGLENIPASGPALIIYYHGTLPVDFYYVMATLEMERGQQIHIVGDRFLFHVPGWSTLLEVFKVTPGAVSNCVEVLRSGHLLSIAPGGVREALFGDENYTVMWSSRCGFAKVAHQANVPIIPMFTMNIREAFRTPGWARAWLRGFYERTRLPLVPIYGFFPVKLKTIFGEPIIPNPTLSHEELRDLVKSRIEDLIISHQPRPGSILQALLQRFPWFR
ncbi:transmembrane protein 68 [Aplysia californica]|uniref:Transmembrane protein 68 n=1 Tax=Aplysia californica TaxID=6500 RepID=A0ABM0K981_APLCA|nr:transmembrane protein 68 [Aplysia californica]XP_005111890.1 transmembrane protein 68 [Aplysia californica]